MDDTEPPALVIELQGVPQPTILTRTRTIEASAVEPDTLAFSCLMDQDPDTRAAGLIVQRVGVVGESVTLSDASGTALHGCDNSQGLREEHLRWCSGTYGRLSNGRLRDPRLSITCHTRDLTPIGFVWVEPSPQARYVAVIEPNYTEVYEVAGGLPVRVTTASGVKGEVSGASFELAEHDAEGRILRRYRLEAAVAG